MQWDEEKLQATDAEKSEFARGQFAEEPKTPFHQPQEHPDNEEIGKNCNQSINRLLKGVHTLVEELRLSSGNESVTISGNESEADSNYSLHSTNSEDDYSSSSSAAAAASSNEKFLALRAQHYLMRGARERGQHLVESEED